MRKSWKKVLAAVLSAAMISSGSVPVAAESAAGGSTVTAEADAEAAKKEAAEKAAAEAKKAEEAKKAAEAKKAEEAKKAAEAKTAEEAKKAAEAQNTVTAKTSESEKTTESKTEQNNSSDLVSGSESGEPGSAGTQNIDAADTTDVTEKDEDTSAEEQGDQDASADTGKPVTDAASGTSDAAAAASEKTAASNNSQAAVSETETSANKTASASAANADTPDSIDNSTTLPDGTYTNASITMTSSSGDNREGYSVPSVTVKDGKAYADIVYSGSSTLYYLQTDAGNTTVQATSEDGHTAFKNVPVQLNASKRIIMNIKMRNPRDTNYTMTVSLSAVAVTGVSIAEGSSAEVSVGGTKSLSAEIAPDNATNKKVSWSSSDDGIVTVSSDGTITGVAAGTAKVTVTTEDGGKTAEIDVTVTKGQKDKIYSLTSSSKMFKVPSGTASVSGNAGNYTVTFSTTPASYPYAFVQNSDGTQTVYTGTSNGSSVEFSIPVSSLDPLNVKFGKTADAPGKSTATLTFSEIPVTGVSVSEGTSTEINVGGTKTLTAKFDPENATNQDVTWSSSDENIVKVSDDGTITGVAAGTAEVTVTTAEKDASGNPYTAKIEVTVTEVKKDVTGVSIQVNGKDADTADVTVGNTLQLTASVTPSDATDTDVTWKSASPSVATVDENGKVTGVTHGTAVITATTEDGGKTDSITVTVKAASSTNTENTSSSALKFLHSDKTREYGMIRVTGYTTESDGKTINITFSSTHETYIQRIFLGTHSQLNSSSKVYVRAKDKTFTISVPYSDKGKTIPVVLGKSNEWRPEQYYLTIPSDIKVTSKTVKSAETKTQAESEKEAAANTKGSTSGSSSVGTYTFRWSGGSGRAYITCSNVEVVGGQAYATITFHNVNGRAAQYSACRAGGTTVSGSNTFRIPVTLNGNTSIQALTTAMSQPHWISYTIYVGEVGAAGTGAVETTLKDNTESLDTEAPQIAGLTFTQEVKMEYSDLLKIYQYEDADKNVYSLLEVDMVTDTAREDAAKDDSASDTTADSSDASAESSTSSDSSSDTASSDTATGTASDTSSSDENSDVIQSDAGTEAGMTDEVVANLYTNKIVKYLVIPEGKEVPAGLDKEVIVVQQPLDKTYVTSEKALKTMEELGILDDIDAVGFEEGDAALSDAVSEKVKSGDIAFGGSQDDPDYRTLLTDETNFAILDSTIIPKKDDKDAEGKTDAELTDALLTIAKRGIQMDMPVFVDRSEDEKDDLAKAEWYKAYGILFGCEDKADELYENAVKAAK